MTNEMTTKTMTLDDIREAAIDHATPDSEYAIVCTDGDIEYHDNFGEAVVAFSPFVEMRTHLHPENEYDYAIVTLP